MKPTHTRQEVVIRPSPLVFGGYRNFSTILEQITASHLVILAAAPALPHLVHQYCNKYDDKLLH